MNKLLRSTNESLWLSGAATEAFWKPGVYAKSPSLVRKMNLDLKLPQDMASAVLFDALLGSTTALQSNGRSLSFYREGVMMVSRGCQTSGRSCMSKVSPRILLAEQSRGLRSD
jgi:hypothetical protein